MIAFETLEGRLKLNINLITTLHLAPVTYHALNYTVRHRKHYQTLITTCRIINITGNISLNHIILLCKQFQVGLYEAEVAELAQRSNQQFLNLVMLT